MIRTNGNNKINAKTNKHRETHRASEQAETERNVLLLWLAFDFSTVSEFVKNEFLCWIIEKLCYIWQWKWNSIPLYLQNILMCNGYRCFWMLLIKSIIGTEKEREKEIEKKQQLTIQFTSFKTKDEKKCVFSSRQQHIRWNANEMIPSNLKPISKMKCAQNVKLIKCVFRL